LCGQRSEVAGAAYRDREKLRTRAHFPKININALAIWCGMFTVELTFRGDLTGFLSRELRGASIVRRALGEKTAVKDVIEACGVPHPEVDLIIAANEDGIPRAVDFSWPVQAPVRMEIHGVPAPSDALPSARRLQAQRWDRFVADGHLGKLARNLRLLGLDTAYERDADDRRLLELMIAEDRALLTRDRRLLMHSIVRHGYCPRAADAEVQTREVLRRFGLRHDTVQLAPYRRCLRCNARLEPIAKSEILASLADEPLTLRYYDDFRRCAGCGRIYWPGTHFEKLVERVEKLIGE
jgi:uncharacterized protein with PIN domain